MQFRSQGKKFYSHGGVGYFEGMTSCASFVGFLVSPNKNSLVCFFGQFFLFTCDDNCTFWRLIALKTPTA
jgi:hypothetical protein